MTVDELSTKLGALRARRAELETRAAQLEAGLDDARRRQGRALADGAPDKELTKLRNEVRSIDDEREAIGNAIEFLAGDIAALEPELVEAERQAAIASAEERNREAAGALEELEATFRAFVLETLLPLEEKWRERDAAASAAQTDAWLRSQHTSEKHFAFTDGYRAIKDFGELTIALAAARHCFTGTTFDEQQANAQARREVEILLERREMFAAAAGIDHPSPVNAP
jgi:hypothetical protein